jgi:ABC-type transport system involved in multi-copper enzyme maturation permease subunit
MPMKLLVALIAITVIFLVLGVLGYNYPSNSYVLLFLVIAVSTWVLCLSFVALSYLNKEVDESDIKKSRG